jgi:hypothetical protein
VHISPQPYNNFRIPSLRESTTDKLCASRDRAKIPSRDGPATITENYKVSKIIAGADFSHSKPTRLFSAVAAAFRARPFRQSIFCLHISFIQQYVTIVAGWLAEHAHPNSFMDTQINGSKPVVSPGP